MTGTAPMSGTPSRARARTPRRAARGVVTAAVTAYLVCVMSAAAFAHVTVDPGTATQGGYAAVTFRVPNERDDANTAGIEVQLPVDTPLASVSVKPHPGWTYEIKKTAPAKPVEAHGAAVTEVVATITWTATDSAAEIKPGEYDEFSVSAGPLPEVDQLVFKTLQRYSNGEVVRWIQEPVPGAEEPERPAPVLRLLPAGATENGTGAQTAAPAADAGRVTLTTDASPAGFPWAVVLSVVSLLISLACAATLLLRLRRAR